MNYGKISGALIFAGSAQFILAVIVAEALYPGYSISQNWISDLGATCRPACQVVQPSAIIFNSSVFLVGALGFIGTLFVWRGFRYRLLPVFFGLTFLGSMGIGLFPETAWAIHMIAGLVTAIFGGLSAIASYRMLKAPLSYFAILLGVMTLISLALWISNVFLGLGTGGMERMIFYPVPIWAMGFGAYLIGFSTK